MAYQLSLMVLCMLLCIIVKTEKVRVKFVLPLCFIILTVFFAIRYDYGFDYHNYLDVFLSGNGSGRGADNAQVESLFYSFMYLFEKFYVFIIVHTLIVFVTLYHLTKKYCDNRYYILFFFLLLTQNGLIFNMISALRSTLAAVILWIALDLFYINNKKWVLYLITVVFASFFHTSVLVFLVLPIIDFIIPKIQSKVLFIIILAASLISLYFTDAVLGLVVSNVDEFSIYDIYSDAIGSSNIIGVFFRSLWLFPTFFICKYSKVFKEKNQGLYVLAVFFILIYMMNLDWQDRFSTYIKIFWIYAFSKVGPSLNVRQKFIALIPLVVVVVLSLYQFINALFTQYRLAEGNYLFYQTIFDESLLQ